MLSETCTTETALPSEEPFTMTDLLNLSVRAEAAEADNDNARRIHLAASVLLHFADMTGSADSTEPADTVVTDLLTDLMHLCAHCWPDNSPVSFDGALNTARMHYQTESDECAEWE
ncbi:MAG: hypothetical protein LBE90_21640 [Pantoea dispersa]|jgi:hypothetical protein|nr:hypothetical protein [Pantoea dispersa]MBZ6393084.1 hypothetical protein [Pantoea dispersa]